MSVDIGLFGWMAARAAIERGKPLRFSWDAACARGYSYQGYGLDELLRRLLLREATGRCDQCGAGDCTHEAARLIVEEMVADFRQQNRSEVIDAAMP